jgi:S1-C subfamily serine protease
MTHSSGPLAAVTLQRLFLLLALTGFAAGHAVAAPSPDAKATTQTVFDSVVRITTKIPASARTAATLGRERDGSGVVIDSNGLVLTIGYVMLEAEEATIGLADGTKIPATLIAYDYETGFGLLRATRPLGVRPIDLGDSSALNAKDRVMVSSFGGQAMAMPAFVVSRRPFAGYWEYLLDNAIFTAPPHPAFGGAALLSGDGKLVGIGSLVIPDAIGPGQALPGNMFIPINRLKPILADLLDKGRTANDRRPWLGLHSQEVHGRLFVIRVSPDGPAQAAGIRTGDLVVGVGGQTISGLADFYRKVWALGTPGVTVPLDILRGTAVTPIPVKSGDRYQWLKLDRSY